MFYTSTPKVRFYGNKVAQIIMTVNYKFEDFEI